MANINGNSREPDGAPQPEKWYNLTLGSSFTDHSSTKFFTLRYEFKPASIDKHQPGSLHKNKENRVTVEFNNNQPGKPKVTFEGSTEDYKDNDGVLFFDCETFRLERLHRAVKRLRHVRLPGESAAAAAAVSSVAPSTSIIPAIESRSPTIVKAARPQPVTKPVVHTVPLEVERIDIGEPESPGAKPPAKSNDYASALQNPSAVSPDPEENLDLDIIDDDEGTLTKTSAAAKQSNSGLDINVPNQNDTDEEIADVDLSDDETDKGPNAAEALRAQVNAEERERQTSSGSSESSGTGSSGSGSGTGSSSSDSEASDDDSASSGGDVDI